MNQLAEAREAQKPDVGSSNRRAFRRGEQRRLRVAAGKCGYCGKPRTNYGYLCDGCAARHREKQRRATLLSPVTEGQKCSLQGRPFIDRFGSQWLVCKHTDDLDPRKFQILAAYQTEQEAERALRRLLFPPITQGDL